MKIKRLVIKFGGVSLKNYERLKNTAEIIKDNRNKELVVVISAIGESTNELIKSSNKALNGIVDYELIKNIHIEICDKLNVDFIKLVPIFNDLEITLNRIKDSKQILKHERNLIMSYGERLSIIVLSEYLNNIGVNAKAVDSWKIGIITNSNYLNAEILESSIDVVNKNVTKLLKKEIIPIVPGFIAKDNLGFITTLGRGGSDLTASFIASAIKADKVILWKDVDGILSSNPKLVENTIKLNNISFKEASEMAFFGAEILHPQSLFPIIGKNISAEIRNFLKPNNDGTIIVDIPDNNNNNKIKAISYKESITMIHIESNRMLGHFGFLAKVFEIFDDLKISVDMIATSEVSISLTLDDINNLENLELRLSEFATVKISNNQSIISLIGNTQKPTSIFNKAFEILKENEIEIKMVSYGASHINISFIIEANELKRTVNILHDGLILESEEKLC
ncbi:MAG: aspartate kinase [Bacillota bacterium]|nr:aspartate kinase [Bacillota bacterium]